MAVMHKFLVVTEKVNGNYSAYAPDLPGCVAAGDTKEETKLIMRDAMRLHLQGLIEDGDPIPESDASAEYEVVSLDD